MKATLLLPALLAAACGSNASNQAAPAPVPAPAVQAPADTGQARRLVERAIGLAEAGDAEGAEPVLLAALEIDPELGLAHAWLGRVYTKLGRYSEARLAHREAARRATGSEAQLEQTYLAAEAAVNAGRRAHKAGNFKQAEELAQDALLDDRASLPARHLLADALFGRGEYAQAREEYQRLADESLGAQRHEALAWVAQCGLRLNENEAAEKVLSALITEGYTGQDVYAWRGWCRANRKEYALARADFRQAVTHASSPERRAEWEAALNEVSKLEQQQ